MTRLAVLLVAACTLGGCGDEAAPVVPPGGEPPAVRVAAATPAAGPDDVVVATVNGQPVWGSCVSTAWAALGDRRRALDECVDLELMAQQAIARDVAATDPESQRALRRVLASALVELEFERKISTAADLPDSLIEEAVAAGPVLSKPEWREAFYVRANVAPEGKPGPTDAAARALIEAVEAALPAKRGLTPTHLIDVANLVGTQRVGADNVGAPGGGKVLEVETRPYHTPDDDRTDPSFRKALFALEAVGDVSPPTRTPWGYDLIIFGDVQPGFTLTPEQAEAHVFPEARRTYFARWFAETVGGRYLVMSDPGVLEAIERRMSTGTPPAGGG